VANTVSDGLTIGSMTYDAAKARIEEDMNTIKVTGRVSNVFNCTLREMHDGIQTGPSSADTDSAFALGAEVYGNRLTRLSDDAIEIDTGYGQSELVANNYSDYTGAAISVAPVYWGPIFVVYNTCLRFKSAGLKIGATNTACGAFYQNTFASKETASRAFEGESGGAITGGTGIDFANNIFVGGLRTIAGPATTGTPPDSTGSYAARFNYNLIDSVGTGRLIKWHGQHFTYALWQAYQGAEANGKRADPGLVAFPSPNTSLPAIDARLSNSTTAYPSNEAVGAGRLIRGVNFGLRGKRYAVSPYIGSKGCADCYYGEE